MKERMKFILKILLFVIIPATVGNAQDKALAEILLSSEKIVKNAPFSAEAISENVQSLADGNKIIKRVTTRMYRDSEGRFRRDSMPSPGGILGAVVELPQTPIIIDPVEGIKFYLNPAAKTARQATLKSDAKFDYDYRFQLEKEKKKAVEEKNIKVVEDKKALEDRKTFEWEKAKEKESKDTKDNESNLTPEQKNEIKEKRRNEIQEEKQKSEKKRAEIDAVQEKIAKKQAEINAKRGEIKEKKADVNGKEWDKNVMKDNPISPDATKTEDLGVRNIEGVEATGTRTTTTIAAGKIGNERPIDIVYERWYSKDLQLIVLSKHNDPRFGEQNYRLTNISRNEPERSLFTLPADYKVLNPFPPKPLRPPNIVKPPAPPKEKPE